MKRSCKFTLLLSASLLPVSVANAAPVAVLADAAVGAAEQTADDAGANNGDIVVTARRKDELLQDVPVAITALSANDLTEKGVTSPQDLRSVTPGLNISGLTRDSANFYIRGQQPGALTSGARSIPGVATYYAEVPVELPSTGVFFDLQNVQILKGPQGTLFGRNTTGGAVLFEPHRAVHDFNGGEAEFQYGNYDHMQVSGYVNVAPVPGVLALRIAGEVQRRDGYTTSVLTGQAKDNRNHEAFRASILLTPNNTIENETIVDYRYSDTNGTGLVINKLNPNAPISSVPLNAASAGALSFALGRSISAQSLALNAGGTVSVACLSVTLPGCPAPVLGSGALGAYAAVLNGGSFYLLAPTTTFNQILATQAAIGPRKNQSPFLTEYLDHSLGVVNKTTFHITDSVLLKNIFSYKVRRQREKLDYTGTPLPILQQLGPLAGQKYTFGAQTLTEELQLQGNMGSTLNYILGGYYENQKPGINQGTSGFAAGSSSIRSFNYNDTSKALFGHVEWSPIEMLTLAGGLRRTWDRRESEISIFKADGVSCNQANLKTGVITCPLNGAKNFAAWSYDFTASLKPTDGVMVYASYRRGYKSGGLNVPVIPGPASDPEVFASYGAEYVNDIEVGLKLSSTLGTVPVRFNLAAFRDDYKNQQIAINVSFQNPDGSTSFTSAIQNVASSKIQGFEAELNLEPVPGLKLGGFASFLDAHPNSNVVDARGTQVTIAGRQLPNQPRWKWGINGSLSQELAGDNGEVTLAANYAWQGAWYPGLLVGLDDVKPAYGVANARLSWERVMGSNIDAAFFANNVFNRTYFLGGYPVGALGFDSVAYGEPRMYGVSLKIRFGAAKD